ncbi:MvaI/BcnI family restriction endonuclease [Falsiruegeria litorea]|uniref:MvaI/BcnI family restriction endonuclease n=1 Tax=Falsiruegeria litorea TaxID=1280831 RepID=UPI001BFD39C7|nr:MvaI/BcnI family restriction endonuclease [Falsiruegeria litorea]MBT8169900.1 hypothetical protein [Falsiruegeria litorea]
MILAADTDISKVVTTFSSLGLQATFLVPTKTAMEKSIIDATHPFREYFANCGSHNYKEQQLGTDHKVLKETFFVGEIDLEETVTSLYRPETKKGDPRVWFYKLKAYAAPLNLLAIIAYGDAVYVINCSDDKVMESIENGSSPLFNALKVAKDGLSPEARELLGLLRDVGKQEWVPNLRAGDTGIGYTLETMLGIPANSSRAPDFKGVEIKSSRKQSSNQTLFAKTPDWKSSRLKSSLELLTERGRFSPIKKRLQLFHSIYADRPNSYGLQLEVFAEESLLKQYCNLADRREDDVRWEISVLKGALKKKHKQTFWVKAKTRVRSDGEEFWYHQGVYTRGPNVEAFPLLLEAGDIFVDYTIKQNPNGSAKDQGYLFRMKKNNLDVLFGKPKIFELV